MIHLSISLLLSVFFVTKQNSPKEIETGKVIANKELFSKHKRLREKTEKKIT